MQHKMIVVLAALLLCVTAWAGPGLNAAALSSDGEGAPPTQAARVSGDIPVGYQPRPAPEPTQGEPPQLIAATDGGDPAASRPVWGPDATVFDGHLGWLSAQKSERMIAYDQTEDGMLFAAFTVENLDTARIYRSTDGGNTWAYWNGFVHTGNVLSSLELVVAEGDSSFVFFFVKSSAGNGDIHVGRWALDGSTAEVFSVKVDADTIANLSACQDLDDHYYLYVAFETRDGAYNMYQLRSTDYGKTWSGMPGTEEILDTETPPKPDICYGNGGNVYTVVRDLRQTTVDSVSFRLKFSPSRGDTWYASTQIGTPAVTVVDPVIGAKHTDNTVWLVHARNLASASGWDIYSYSSIDSGLNWGLRSVANTDSSEQMPSIACNLGSGSATLCYEVTPGESIMFTWASEDTNWTVPERASDNQATGFFAPQAGWKNNFSTVLYAGYTAVGLYFDAWSMVGLEEGRPVPHKPLQVSLAARPSPAHDRTVINYSLPSAGRARVSVSDVAGREIAVLSGGTLTAGARSAVWNCANVPAGVYLVRLETDAGSQTGRIVVSH